MKCLSRGRPFRNLRNERGSKRNSEKPVSVTVDASDGDSDLERLSKHIL